MKKIKFYFKRLYEIIMTPSMSYLPGNIAFFLVLSIFPILTLIGVIASKFSLDLSTLIDLEEIVLPNNLSELLASFVQGKGFDSNIGIFMIMGMLFINAIVIKRVMKFLRKAQKFHLIRCSITL